MRIDFSASEVFLAYLAGRASLHDVLDHPAYKTVCLHARLFGAGLTSQDVADAIQGKPSPFYGLDDVAERETRIRTLLATVRENEQVWLAAAQTALSQLLPEENLDITIYPTIGYDMGIGLDGAVCMNCNCEQYLAQPVEFLFYMIHECVHVIYERHHRIPALAEVTSPAQWRAYFNLWLQDEGYAVYAPLRLRQEMGYLAERDYRVLCDASQVNAHRIALLKALDAMQQGKGLVRDEYLDHCFGPLRLTYRMGCELIRRIERSHGSEAVREAFYWDARRFVETYVRLLNA